MSTAWARKFLVPLSLPSLLCKKKGNVNISWLRKKTQLFPDENWPMYPFHHQLLVVLVADYSGRDVLVSSPLHAIIVPDTKLKLREMLCENR